MAGFEVISPKGFPDPETAANAALQSGAAVTVICSTDPTYPEIVPALTAKIKAENPQMIVVLAGYPADQIEQHKASGVDYFIHVKANVVQILGEILQRLGVTA